MNKNQRFFVYLLKILFHQIYILFIMKKLLLLFLLSSLLLSCKKDKSELPSGNPKEILKSQFNTIANKYTNINDFEYGYSIVYNKQYGLIDVEGNEILPCNYDTIFTVNPEIKLTKKNGKYGIIKYDGDIIVDNIYDEYDDFNKRKYIKYLEPYPNREYIVLGKQSKYGVFDYNGKEIIPMEYDKICDIDNKTILLQKNGLCGLADSLGNIVIDIEYDTIFLHHEDSNISLALKNNLIGIINSSNQLVTNCEYNCEFLLDGKIPRVDEPCEGYIKLEKYFADRNSPKKYGYINCENGVVSIPFEYDDLGNYSEGLIWAEKDKKYGYIDINNNVVIPFIYDRAYDFSDGLAAVEKYDHIMNTVMGPYPYYKTGFIDKHGDFVIYPKYNTQAFNKPLFKEGLAPIGISQTNLYGLNLGYIDRKGDFIVKPIYEEAKPFENGFGIIKKNDKYGCVNTKGELFLPIEYESIDFSNKIGIISKEGKTGCIDYNGKIIIPLEYDFIKFLNDSLIFACNYHGSYSDIDEFFFNIKGEKLR